MKFSENWLREWVDPPIDTKTILNQLTMAGLEVEGTEAVANFTNVVVGKIIELEKHPDANKLKVAKVDVGNGGFLQIVCGAKNAKIGLKTATALVGATLGENFKIKKSKLRGIESQGMLCSSAELGLETESDGIIELAEQAKTGQSIIEYFELDDNIIEVNLTPNRGDCLSILGVAREVSALNKTPFKQISPTEIAITSSKKIPIEIDEVEKCPAYLGRVIENIDPKSKTPLWMQEKLRRGGIRSLGPLVDVTNYVALELGQPMHAFDLAKINQKIVVRNPKPNETLKMLDGTELKLKPDTLMIADAEKPLAIAGVMGGLNSGISEATQDLFLECAYFDKVKIAGVARSYGMHTEASHRYERGVDYNLQKLAINRASQLLLEIVGGECGEIVVVDNITTQRPEIKLDKSHIKKLLGIAIAGTEITNILTGLGMEVRMLQENSWLVIPPSFRFDINITADLIEEIGRIYGYNNIKSSKVSIPAHLPKTNEAQRSVENIKQFFVNRDYQEAISYSFVSPDVQQTLTMDKGAENLSNPISQDLSQMRTSLMPGLIKATSYNLNRQHHRVRLFEIGLRFFRDDKGKLQQIPSLAGIVCGTRFKPSWNENTNNVDYYDIKLDLESLLQGKITFKAGLHPALHPKQTAEIFCGSESIGFIGKIHPYKSSQLDVLENTYLFELDLAPVQKVLVPQFKPISKFPKISRDLSIVIDSQIPSQEIIEKILAIKNISLKSAHVFDIYFGENVDKLKQSLAINVVLQADDKTLIDADIDASINKIVNMLVRKYQANLRSR